MAAVYAAVEGGGTTFVAVTATGEPPVIVERAEFTTKIPPSETIKEVAAWLSERNYDALGVACFGPLDLDPDSKTFGFITTTPKPGWTFTDVLGPLRAVRPVPFGFDTDVNAPAVEEFRRYGRPGEESCAYVTVGTGIGVGLVVNGRRVKGLVHPEGGHIPILKRPSDAYKGQQTSRHPWSLEASCCAGAIAERAGVTPDKLKDIPDDSEVWADVAWCLGSMCASLILMISVERIVLGGGVMTRLSLFPKVRQACRTILNDYIQHPRVLANGPDGIDGLIVPSERGNDAGIHGAVGLAVDALKEARARPGNVVCTSGCHVQ